jgi:hypothetical protein
MSVSNCAPMRASASCIPIADRSPLPSSSMSATMAASPSLPSGSLDDPDRTSSMYDTIGTAAWRTLHTRRPLDSTDLSIDGNVKARAAPGSGNRDRSTLVVVTTLS